MVLELVATEEFKQALKNYHHRTVLRNKLYLLKQNPRHPSLRVHKVRRARKGILECYVSDGDRILFEVVRGELRLWYLGPHSMLDRVHQSSFAENKTFSALGDGLFPLSIREANTNYNPGTLPLLKDKSLSVLEAPTAFLRKLKDAITRQDALESLEHADEASTKRKGGPMVRVSLLAKKLRM